jgi:replicative DNA helicase
MDEAENRTIERSMQLPPQSGTDEQALLGALLDDNRHYSLLAMLSADDFADPVHATIYEAIARNLGAGRTASRSTLKRDLMGKLGEVGGGGYLDQLYGDGCDVIASARIILKMAVLREHEE